MSYINNYIDTSVTPPELKDHRINILDILAAIEGSDNTQQTFNYWELTDDEIKASLLYIIQNYNNIQQLEEKEYKKYK